MGSVGGLLGLLLRSRLLSILLVAPAVYVVFLLGAAASMRDLPPAARLRFPLVLAVMHVCWGAGFIKGRPEG